MKSENLRHHGVTLSAFFQRLYRGPDFPARLRILGWLHRLAGNKRLVVTGRQGARFAVDPGDYVQSSLLFTGAYESEVIEAVRRYIQPGDVVFDFGANVGSFSLEVHKATGAAVVAFEADPLVADILRLNARLSGLDESSFLLLQCAVADISGYAGFHRAPGSNIGRSSLEDLVDSVEDIQVAVATVDELRSMGRIGHARCWKLDVEGAELRLLAGARSTLLEFPPDVIAFEDAAADVANSAIAVVLSRLGYKCERILRPSGEVHARENFLALRA